MRDAQGRNRPLVAPRGDRCAATQAVLGGTVRPTPGTCLCLGFVGCFVRCRSWFTALVGAGDTGNVLSVCNVSRSHRCLFSKHLPWSLARAQHRRPRDTRRPCRGTAASSSRTGFLTQPQAPQWECRLSRRFWWFKAVLVKCSQQM